MVRLSINATTPKPRSPYHRGQHSQQQREFLSGVVGLNALSSGSLEPYSLMKRNAGQGRSVLPMR